MANVEELKNEIDTNKNKKIDTKEMEEFLKTDGNLTKLWEALNSNLDPELKKEFWKSLWDLSEKIATQKVFIFFEKIKDIKKISLNELNIVHFFITEFRWAEFENDDFFKKLGKTHEKIYQIIGKRATNYLKRKGEYDQWLRSAKNKDEYIKKHYAELGPYPELWERMEQNRREKLQKYIEGHPIEPVILWEEQIRKEKEKREQDKELVQAIIDKDEVLTEQDIIDLKYFRDYYYGYHNAYRNSNIDMSACPKHYFYRPSPPEYDEIARKIDERLENDEIFKKLGEEVESSSKEDLENPLKNLESLWVNTKSKFNWNNLINDIKTIEDVAKIDKTTIWKYIKMDLSKIPEENYDYQHSNHNSNTFTT